jgi:phospholipase C
MSRSAAAAAGFFVTSCIGERLSTSPEPRPSFSATSTPAAVPTRWPVDRVVYLMLENRSFDNIFGRYPGANGTRTGVRWGEEVRLRRCPEWLPGDLPHDTASWHAMHNGGKMDGFAIGEYGPYFAYSQFDRPDVPNYFRWADEFVLCDNFFASVAGPSYPNHLYMIAGQAGGAINNPENIKVKQLNDGRGVQELGL